MTISARMDVLSPDQIEREREMFDNARALARMQRKEETDKLWHGFSKAIPLVVTFLILCFLGVIGFTSFKIMGDNWIATSWGW